MGQSNTDDIPVDPPEPGLAFMCLLAFCAGIIGGVGAWFFRLLIGLVHNILFLGVFSLQYDTNLHTPLSPWGWGVILVPVAGSVFVAWLVKNFAPEAKGHGVPEVMEAIHYRQGRIRPRVAVVKSLASAISLGSGGAVGREGPIVQIGAAFGSTLGQFIRMSARQRIVLIAAGASAGIAATFNAPLGGVVFAVELLLLSISAVSILLVAIATVTATQIGRILLGTTPSFHVPALELPNFHLTPSWELLLFMVLGALTGLISIVFIRGIYWAEDRFDGLSDSYYVRHALGMLGVGLLIAVLSRFSGHYYVQGVGYATIVDVLTGALTDPWFLLALTVLKLLATCLSLGSGASGGVFSPILFMGATTGAAFGQVTALLFPDTGVDVATFAVVGMGAGIAGSTGAVLTGIVMISEMTQDHSVVLPLVIAVATAYAVRRAVMRESIYTMKLVRRGLQVPEDLESAISSARNIDELMSREFVIVDAASDTRQTADVLIIAEQDRVAGVYAFGHNGCSGDGKTGPSDRFVIMPAGSTFLETARALKRADADVVLVSGNPASRRAGDILGVLTMRELLQHLKDVAELL